MQTPETQPIRQISLFDGICLVVGIIVGVGIFESAPAVALHSPNARFLIGIWIFGGVLSLLGALTYAGLAQTYPETGGDYVFLKKAFGPRVSFLYAWTMLMVVRPGNIGAMAYVFARYAHQMIPLGEHGLFIYASGAVLLLSFLNLLGTREGKGIQNFLTVSKVLGIGLLVATAWMFTTPDPSPPPPEASPSFILALIFVLFAYGGWNEIAFVGAEVKRPEKNLFRVLVFGTLAVTALYLVVNLSYLHALGFDGLQARDGAAVSHAIMARHFGMAGAVFVASLISLSALGTVHGMIFSGARIYYAMGRDHRLFAPLGSWSKRGTPFWSIIAEACITIALMSLFFSSPSGFESLVLFTTPNFWIFMALVGVAAFKLLGRKGHRILGYPFTPAVFLLMCLFMLGMSAEYAYSNMSVEILWSCAILLAGIVLERIQRL